MPVTGGAEIPRSELLATRERVVSAYELVRRLRPEMLNSRTQKEEESDLAQRPPRSGSSDVAVYVDDVYVGGLESLSLIAARSVASVRRISPATASARFGAQISAGAILITTDIGAPRAYRR